MNKRTISGLRLDEERTLYHLQDARVTGCVFDGPADGESALKETGNIDVENCHFALRYPLWHTRRFTLADSRMVDTCRAALWYAEEGRIDRCELGGIKVLRECRDIRLDHTRIRSAECGWKCRDLSLSHCSVEGEYCFLELRDSTLTDLTFSGKYSFQYVENVVIENADLDTKDAFWHSRNVTVKNSRIRGEYLGWYSEGLTLVNCCIIGTQPLCYCTGLRMENCRMEEADLAFECSDVSADIRGHILSVKNPHTGRITADSIGEIILDDPVMDNDCQIIVK